MQPNSFDVIRIPTNGPGDVSGLMALIDGGALDPSSVLAVLGKTEGNGGVNDFTREYAVAALCNALSSHLKLAPREVEARIAFVMSGGTEGVLSPHITVFTRSRRSERVGETSSEKRLSVGIAHTRDFLPEEIGRDAQIEETMHGCRGGNARRSDRGRQRCAFCPDQMPASDQRARSGRSRPRQDDGHRERLCVDGLFARRIRHRRRQSARRDRRRGRRTPGAEGLGALFIGRVVLGRHRTHAQCRHSDRQFALFVEPVQNWPCGDAGCDRSSGGDAGARERGVERDRYRNRKVG